jgi:hypothetical protein
MECVPDELYNQENLQLQEFLDAQMGIGGSLVLMFVFAVSVVFCLGNRFCCVCDLRAYLALNPSYETKCTLLPGNEKPLSLFSALT